MLNEERVITMTKMAMYDKGIKKHNLRVTSYYRMDYITFQTIMTLLWATLGYIILVAIILMTQIDEITTELSIDYIIEKGILIGMGYVGVLIAFGAIAVMFYTMKYQNALKIVKPYYQALGALNTEYKKEK